MIEAWVEKIAVRIKRANVEETVSVPVMKFALIIVFNILIPVVVSLGIGLATGKLAGTLLAIGAFTLLRMISGGYHFSSPIPCMISTAAVMSIPPHLLAISEKWTVILTIISLIFVAWLAPANLRGYNTMPEKYYPLLKIASVIVVASNFIVGSQIAALVFSIQGFLLLFQNKEV